MEIYHPKDEELLREMKRIRRVLSRKRLLWGLLISLVLSAAFGWFVFSRYATLAVQRGPAMGDTLPNGSVVLIGREAKPKYRRGDIVLYTTESGSQIKRILAVGGDQVVVSPYGGTRVNGVVPDEPYATGRNEDTGVRTHRLQMEEGTVFVQGDQRSLSVDSRYTDFEVVREADIVGKVRFVLWPLYMMGELEPEAPAQQGGGT